ncbi:hypothetical protein ABZ078_08730 [Streptomyces sp. NPDC006385]|uniref:hypothetical protein n=1 Tax=Streptomyces sp. NPDC006385 TaxID=3156761 RepID=UPI0033BAAC0A
MPTEHAVTGKVWDSPWYRVRTDRFEASFLIGEDEEPDTVCDVDVFVRLADGSRWCATVFTVAAVQRLMELWSHTGEAMGGRYFWCSDELIVRDPGVDSMTEVIAGLIDCGDFSHIFQRLEDEEDDDEEPDGEEPDGEEPDGD